MDRLVIRPGRPTDLPRIVAIYNHWVTASPVTFDLEPTTVEARRGWFAEFATPGRWQLLVADADGDVAGFAYSHRHRPKPAYDTSVETSVYVAPERLGQGLGRRLLVALIDALEREDVHRAFAGIALPNDASVSLHESLGFREIGTFSEAGRKFGRYWSVRWLERAFPEAGSGPAKPVPPNPGDR